MLLSLGLGDIFVPFFGLLYMLFLNINAFLYNLVCFAYQVFLAVASAQIFSSEQYQNLAQKIYLVLGVVALFLVAYSLLRAIIDPDNASKGDSSAGKIVGNLIKVIVLLAFTPTIFNMAYTVQSAILKDNIIPKIVLGESFDEGSVSTIGESQSTFDIATVGNTLTNEMFTDFITNDEIDAAKASANASNDDTAQAALKAARSKIVIGTSLSTTAAKHLAEAQEQELDAIGATTSTASGGCWNYDDQCAKISGDITYQSMYDAVENGTVSYNIYSNLGESIAKDKLNYNFFLQLIVGIFMLYAFVSFSIDMGVRVVKLAYYQIIAPIPILTLIIPSQKKIFDNWKSGALSTYAEVFIRLAIVMLGMVLIQSLPSNWSSVLIDVSKTPALKFYVRLFLIIGILIFMKQAPKLISDMFGLKPGSFKLGIGDKLSEMALLGGTVNKARGAISGAVGAGYSSLVNGGSFLGGAKYGMASGWKDGKKNPHQLNAQRQGLYSTLGYKGKAGIFGGQAFMDKWVDDTRNSYTDDYKDRVLSARLEPQINLRDPNSTVNKYYDDALATKKAEYAEKNASDQIKFDQKQAELNALQAKNNEPILQEKAAFESNKNQQMSQINNQISAVKSNLVKSGTSIAELNDNSAVQALQQKLSEIQNSTFEQTATYSQLRATADQSEKSLVNDLDTLQSAMDKRNEELNTKTQDYVTHVYDPIHKKLVASTEAKSMTKVEQAAYNLALSKMQDADETFKNQFAIYKGRIDENNLNTYKNSASGQQDKFLAKEIAKALGSIESKNSSKSSDDKK